MPLRLEQPDSPLKIANFSTLSQTADCADEQSHWASGIARRTLGVVHWILGAGPRPSPSKVKAGSAPDVEHRTFLLQLRFGETRERFHAETFSVGGLGVGRSTLSARHDGARPRRRRVGGSACPQLLNFSTSQLLNSSPHFPLVTRHSFDIQLAPTTPPTFATLNPHLGLQISDVRCQTSDFCLSAAAPLRSELRFSCQTSDIRHQTSDTRISPIFCGGSRALPSRSLVRRLVGCASADS
jgi:hypothetical protein